MNRHLVTAVPVQAPRPAGKDSLVRTLTGHSGCEVSLRLEGDTYFVRKRSGSPAYNARLQAQIEKQIALSSLIATPEVLRSGQEDGLVWFDMAYVEGHGFMSYAPLQKISRISAMVEQLAEPLQLLAATSTGTIEAAMFGAKLDELSGTVPASVFFSRHRAFLESLLARLSNADWSGIPKSLCHGDLTVENMLMLDDGGIVFIDFLDGGLESVWMDVAKLIQDLETGWSLRSVLWNGRPDPAARLLGSLSRYLAEEVESRMTQLFPGLDTRLDALRALQALRVLPYVRDASIFENVVAGLASLRSFKDLT